VDYFDLSKGGKAKLLEFTKQKHKKVCISMMVKNAPNEETLLKMIQWIETGVMPK
jgi:hypothetical protein